MMEKEDPPIEAVPREGPRPDPEADSVLLFRDELDETLTREIWEENGRKAFFDPFGEDAGRAYCLENKTPLREFGGYPHVGDVYFRPDNPFPGVPYGLFGASGVVIYSLQHVQSCLTFLMENYLKRAEGQISDAFINQALEALEQWIERQIQGVPRHWVGLEYSQIKVLMENETFQAHPRYGQFKERYDRLRAK